MCLLYIMTVYSSYWLNDDGWICFYEYPEARSFISNLWKNLADVSFLIHSITNSYNTPDGRFLDSHAWHAGKCRSAINEQGQFFGHLGRLVSRCFICGGPAQLLVVVNYVIIRRKWCKEAIQVWQMNNCQLLIRCERNWIQDLFTFLSQLLQIFFWREWQSKNAFHFSYIFQISF